MAKTFRKARNLVIDMTSEASEVVVDLLKVLKSRYDYRALSAITGFPISTLTRYITGKTSPKGVKAEKLLRNLLTNINLTALIASDIGRDSDNLDLTKIMLNPSIIRILGAHVIGEFIGMKITSILPLDILSIPLATYLASVTSRRMYIISPEPMSTDGGSIPIVFAENGHGAVRAYWFIAKGHGKGESVLIVSSKTPDPFFFNNLLDTLKDLGMELGGFFTVLAKEEDLQKMKIPPGVKRSYIFLS